MEGTFDGNYLWYLLRVFCYLGAIVVFIVLIRKFVLQRLYPGNFMNREQGEEVFLKQRLSLGNKGQLVVVECRNRVLLLGVTENNVNLLGDFPVQDKTGGISRAGVEDHV